MKKFRIIEELMINCLLSGVLFILSFVIKRNNKYIAIGSWCGDRYADNSRYLAEYIYNNEPDLKIFWVGNKTIEKEVEGSLPQCVFLEKGKLSTYLSLLKCKYFFFTQMHDADITPCNVYRGAILCYLHHGMPIKKWGADGLNIKKYHSNIKKAIVNFYTDSNRKYDYFVTSSHCHDITNCTSLINRGCTMAKNLHTGTPRNDLLINAKYDEIVEYKKKYSIKIGYPIDRRVIFYAPTYRRTKTDVFSFSLLSKEELAHINAILNSENAIIIEKSHVAEKNVHIKGKNGDIYFADSYMNIQEMMLFTDLLISDYSGAYLDFILMDKPVIHYAYDYNYYKDVDSGLYYNIEDFAAGKIVYTFSDLVCEIKHILDGYDDYSEKRKKVREKYMEYEKGNASQRIVEEVIKVSER